jgi:hypothetical protein
MTTTAAPTPDQVREIIARVEVLRANKPRALPAAKRRRRGWAVRSQNERRVVNGNDHDL